MSTAGAAAANRAPSNDKSRTVHATCLVLGEDGILLRGPSGSGKSSLCLALLDEADKAERHARLVGDDCVRLDRLNGRLIGHTHPALDGLIEIRGSGIRRFIRTAQAAVIRLVVDLVAQRSRLPEDTGALVALLDVRLPVLRLEPFQPREYLVRERLAALRHDTTDGDPGRGAISSVSS